MTISCGSQIARCCAPRSHQAQLQKPGIALRKLRFAVRTAANQAFLAQHQERNKMGTKKGRTDVRPMGGKYY
jgi:hypothetical protein